MPVPNVEVAAMFDQPASGLLNAVGLEQWTR